MATEGSRRSARVLIDAAERLQELGDTAELMGDEATASRLRSEAARCQARAMEHLDPNAEP